MSSFYVTTPIYYVNGAPHLGHVYTTLIADTLAIHHRDRGDDVFFLTGTDEHGLKVQRAAEDLGISPQALADQNAEKFKVVFDKYKLTYDRFIRTTEADHKATVTEVVNRMKAKGDIYLDTYAGWYSASDEAFYDESEIEDGKVIASGSAVEWVEESSYFFKLSKYENQLLDWYKENDTNIKPDSRRNEVASFVSGGLRDLSISRTTFDWGIDFPGDPEHVLYVWVDALTNYLTGVGGFTDKDKFAKYWPADCQLLGKDILRFHAVYWPAFLFSIDITPPKQVFAHGWWVVDNVKMSKSLGNFIDAGDLADEFSLDVLRYFLTREIPLGSDGNFSRVRVVERNNSELADNLGNLVNRSFAMTEKFLEGQIPKFNGPSSDPLDSELVGHAKLAYENILAAMDRRETHRALEFVMSFSSEINLYIQKTQPWKLNKEDKERVAVVLYHILEAIRWVCHLANAFLPNTAPVILEGLGVDVESPLKDLSWGGLAPSKINSPPVLFEKLDPKAFEAKIEEPVEPEEKVDYIEFDDFLAVNMRVGKILEAEAVEGADKLLKLEVDLGERKNRQVVAGIAKSYGPGDLIGKKVAVVSNLKPRKIFKILSEGMLLAADTEEGGLQLTFYPENVSVGTRLS